MKSQEDYLKEIAEQINKAKCFEINEPTIKDVENLKDFDYILSEGKYTTVIIRKRYMIDTVLGIPTVFWYDGFEIGDNIMGIIPETMTAEEVLEELKGFKD